MLYIYIIMLKIECIDKETSRDIFSQIAQSISAFEEKYAVNITIHTMSGQWYDRKLSYLFPRWRAHRASYCKLERYSRKKYNNLCLRDCAAGVEKESLRSGEPFLHSCWKGVKELIVPFLWNDVLELIFYIGPFKGENPPEEMRKYWNDLPDFSEDLYSGMVGEVRMLGYAFYALLLQENQRQNNELPNREELIREYILRNSGGKITLSGLARYLGVSTSRASHLCKTFLGVPFQEQVMNVRLKKAEALLRETDEPIKAVAAGAGFSNVYYFSRMFRKFFGYPPGSVRKKKGRGSPF